MTPFKLPDRYTQTTESYEGGHGIVWVYNDTDLHRKVAVKFMKPAEDQSQLLRELASLRAIRSKHIAQIYDLQFQKNTKKPALIQEYVAGPDLWDIAKQHPTGDEILLILYQIASGIADVHDAGKIHRDINPTNIKRDSEGILKLLDFGLTCDAVPEPATQHARGTHAFRAPEMYLGPPARITKAVDTYAFGVTATTIFLDGKIPGDLKKVPPSLPAPSFTTFASGLRAEICEILDATLSASPKDRPEMNKVRQALADQVLFGKHRALVSESSGSKQSLLSKPNQAIRLTAGDRYLQIGYDGAAFKVQDVSSGVSINNTVCSVGITMPESCVITLDTGPTRVFYLFDVSHPEVVL